MILGIEKGRKRNFYSLLFIFLLKLLVVTAITFIVSIFLYAKAVFSYPEYTVYSPTAMTLLPGFFSINVFSYEDGGIFLSPEVYINKYFSFGFSGDVERAVGEDDPQFNIPAIKAKIKLTDGPKSFPISFAIGYDTFYPNRYGKVDNEDNKLNRLLQGPYFVITKPLFIFGTLPHLFTVGVRIPVQPFYEKDMTELFIGYSFPFGNILFISFELTRIVFSKGDNGENIYPVFSFSLDFMIFENFFIGFALSGSQGERLNRVAYIRYRGYISISGGESSVPKSDDNYIEEE